MLSLAGDNSALSAQLADAQAQLARAEEQLKEERAARGDDKRRMKEAVERAVRAAAEEAARCVPVQ